MFSKYFINRPVLSAVIAMIIMLLGFVAIKTLPISQLPNLTPPTVVVSAQYPGADAQTIANNILTPLESQISGADGLMYMSSKAAALPGTATITCTFNIGVNQDMAAVDVQNRINSVLAQLPQTTRDLGVTVQKKTSDILLIVAITSPDGSYDATGISNYISANLLDEIKKIPGAGRSQIFGQRDYAMRVWLNPDKMASLGVSSSEIAAAIKDQNLQVSPGRLGQAPTNDAQMWTMQLTSKGRFSTPEEFQNIIIRSKSDGSMIRLKDVARVELGSQNYEFFGRVNGKPAAMIGIFADTNANALDTSKAVAEKMEKLSKKFPKGIVYNIPYDTTDFVKISIEEVVFTLLASIILVSLVIYLFLQSSRAAMIPILSIPISLTGAFIGMYLLGYSINTLTLFGLVLAIGIVVDDAIVVIENMERILQTEKLSPREAAIKAMAQISGPVIAIVLVMCAVFIPATFLGGMTGQLYKQFAATIAISVVFSGFMALTFAPAIGALILKHHEQEPARFFRWFNRKFGVMTENYVRRSGYMIRKSLIFLVIYLSTYFFIGFFHKTLPSAFLPMEDQGYFITSITLPDGATANRTLEVVKQVEDILSKQEGVYKYTAITGLNILTFSQEPNAAVIFTRLKPWEERTTKELKVFGILNTLGPKLGSIKEAKVFAMPPPPIRGMGPSDMFSLRLLQPGDNDYNKLAQATNAFVADLRKEPSIKNPMSTMNINTPTLSIEVNREKAKMLGLSISDVFQTLQATIGTMYINQFDKNGKTYWVQMQSDSPYRATPEDIGRAWVRSSSGQLVPLSSVVTAKMSSAPSSIEHFNGVLCTTVMGSPSPGYSSGDLIKVLEEKGDTVLPNTISYDWEGLYLQEKLVGSKALMIMAFALVMVYLILSALYERWTLPISIMLAVPYGIMGAYTVVWLIPFLNNNVFFQIGLLTLIALSAKNAILVVEFAEEQRLLGKSVYDSAMEAARLRYRPMMMTSFAFLAGMLPLIFSSGAGSAGRFSIGVAMFGGMLAATFIERYFIPFLYYWVATAQEKFAARKGVDHE
ncbi:MAG: hydrophobe/amphiphile efflux-1 family RND transporter [Sulfuricurvum sp. PD_MW2]|jgi:hydrophobe/amphiphile efflux-1 (HAE1) family protein|uniref:efflux RND transporter permease subunit n=1 Tax=Sulfuricurvum sp. PD_MW2 TaxID=2027917 RepID=UPI000C0672B1|nr:multidrug efflux RND transporter permease subunit [Sulfuricurvum sp. PD_MW2]PHM17870.1 MAG: hydrophobe/amphiphile efflux-1 family RND transporter [Sulfuricurvum sp. PD_MW2]